MEQTHPNLPPRRITDLVALKRGGADVVVDPAFESTPVDFTQRDNPYRAHIFLCRYAVTVDGRPYSFRKCYARGCPNNLCPHVSQAVMIANRYLQRDYATLEAAGIAVDDTKLFELGEMLTKFESGYSGLEKDDQDEGAPGSVKTLFDYIEAAKSGTPTSAEVVLEYLPAVEHFSHYQNAQTFLYGRFHFTAGDKAGETHRCLSCFPTESEEAEKPVAVDIANQRLKGIYDTFDGAGIRCETVFFE